MNDNVRKFCHFCEGYDLLICMSVHNFRLMCKGLLKVLRTIKFTQGNYIINNCIYFYHINKCFPPFSKLRQTDLPTNQSSN